MRGSCLENAYAGDVPHRTDESKLHQGNDLRVFPIAPGGSIHAILAIVNDEVAGCRRPYWHINLKGVISQSVSNPFDLLHPVGGS